MSIGPQSGIHIPFTGDDMSASTPYDKAVIGAVRIARAVLAARRQEITGASVADEITTCGSPEYEAALLATQAEVERDGETRGDRERAAFILSAPKDTSPLFAEAVKEARESLIPGGLVASQRMILDGEMDGNPTFEAARSIAVAIADARGLLGPEAAQEILLTNTCFPELKDGRGEIEKVLETKRSALGDESLIEEMAFGATSKYGKALEAADEVMSILEDAIVYDRIKEAADWVASQEASAKSTRTEGRAR